MESPRATLSLSSKHKLISVEQFRKLPTDCRAELTDEDIARLQAKHDNLAKTAPVRLLTGTFRCPWGLSPADREKFFHSRVKIFIDSMEKRGWTLRSRISITGPYVYRDEQNVPVLGYSQYQVQALFSIDAKPVKVPVLT